MKILSSDLINLPVYTQGGQHLGRVTAFEVDIDGHTITTYHVKTGLIKGLWHQELLINPSQVISISLEKMVVEDSVTKAPEVDLENARVVAGS